MCYCKCYSLHNWQCSGFVYTSVTINTRVVRCAMTYDSQEFGSICHNIAPCGIRAGVLQHHPGENAGAGRERMASTAPPSFTHQVIGSVTKAVRDNMRDNVRDNMRDNMQNLASTGCKCEGGRGAWFMDPG